MPLRLAALTLLVLLAAAVPASAARRDDPRTLYPLHAEPDAKDGGRIVDSRGRTVLLRGVNVNAFAEYWQGTPLPTTFPLARKDPERIAAIGWNAVRLLVSWSRVEPQPGAYDEAYLATVAAAIKRFQKAGVYTIVDFHQDAWGPSLAARDGETCPPESEPALGWDGAPAWATLDGGLPRCAAGGIREANAAVQSAWNAFFTDEQGVQTRYVAMLAHVAARFRATRAVAGYDLMNEPNAFGPAQEKLLSDFYGRALLAIRDAGSRQLVLFEPSALFSATGRGAPPDFPRDRDVVYAPHLYTGGFDGGSISRDAFTEAATEAKGFGGAPVLSGEWGGDPGRAGPGGDGYFLAHQALQDEFAFSAALWTWRESCGDPHKVGDVRAGRVPKPWGEFDVDCRDNRVTGVRTDLVNELSRGYVRAAPGTAATKWDPVARRLDASGAARTGAAPVVAFVPLARRGERATATPVRGLRRFKTTRVSGGALVSARPLGGAWSLVVRVRPTR
ncbi:MAG: endoglycosylceramidase [Thermoleophilaceae bacterium]|nr:endoglycosylceramidase [Thermoleophilaceae bacterium]